MREFVMLYRERREALLSLLDRLAAYRLEKEVQEVKQLLKEARNDEPA